MIGNLPIYHKNRLIQIFQDHWEEFKRFHPSLVNEDIEANVQKMMGCGMFSNGYAEYRCRDFYYFDYKILRKKWMYILLSALKKTFSSDPEALRLICRQYSNMSQK